MDNLRRDSPLNNGYGLLDGYGFGCGYVEFEEFTPGVGTCAAEGFGRGYGSGFGFFGNDGSGSGYGRGPGCGQDAGYGDAS